MHHTVPRTVSGIVAIAVMAAMLALPTGAASAIPIEGAPRYQPQTTCAPKPKPGTRELARHLMNRYPGTGSMGISRACSSGGTSEHKEGRAFDWRVNASSKRDRGYAASFLNRIRRTDRAGHRNALARRMGIMYVIWNDHIYSAGDGYSKRTYRHSSCRRIKRCSPTLRHRDHMHISLSWPGARGKTSWYRSHGSRKQVRKGLKQAKATAKARAGSKATAKAKRKATVKRTAKVDGVEATAKATATARAKVKAAASATAKAKAKAKAKKKAKAKLKAKKKARKKAHRKARKKAHKKAKREAKRKAKRKARSRAEARAARKALRKARAKAAEKAERLAERKTRARTAVIAWSRNHTWDREAWTRLRQRFTVLDREDWRRLRDRLRHRHA